MLDVVIIGAGAAGIVAARSLAAAGVTFRLIEARSRVGGRAFTETQTLGLPVDLGCHWLHSPAFNPLVPIAESMGIRVGGGSEDCRVTRSGRFLDADELSECPAYIDHCFESIVKAGRTGRDGVISELFPNPGPWHSLFETEFMAKQGVPANRASIKDFARYVWEGDNRPVHDGLGAFIGALAADTPVELSTSAKLVDWSKPGRVTIETNRGPIEARAAIITVPTGVLTSDELLFYPSLPDWKIDAIENLPMGSCNKVAPRFAQNIFDDCNMTVIVPELDPGLSVELVVRPADRNLVVAMINGPFGKSIVGEGKVACRTFVLSLLTDIFGKKVQQHALSPTLIVDWDSDPFIRGCYAAALPGRADSRVELARPIDNCLYFAGEATSVEYAGDVHGAYLSGISAAEAVAEALRTPARF